jgi:hypothetical protein
VLQAAYGGKGEGFVLNLTEAKVDGIGTSEKTLADVLDKALEAAKKE